MANSILYDSNSPIPKPRPKLLIMPSIEPVEKCLYIMLTNSDKINYDSIINFIEKRFVNYEKYMNILNINTNFCLKFIGENYEANAHLVYTRLVSKQRIINNSSVDFSKPQPKPICDTFTFFEIPSPPSSPMLERASIINNTSPIIERSVAVSVMEESDIKQERACYIYIDHSNIIAGGNQSGYKMKTDSIVKALEFNKINEKRWIIKRNLVGSGMLANIIRAWEFNNYTVCNYPTGREYGVDEILKDKIRNELDTNIKPTYCHMILVTGDGNRKQESQTFPDVVEIAIKKGWTVDVYSWEKSLSLNFKKLELVYPKQFNIYFLDKCDPFVNQVPCIPEERLSNPYINPPLNVEPFNAAPRNAALRNTAPRNAGSRNAAPRNAATHKVVSKIISNVKPQEMTPDTNSFDMFPKLE
jgi:hypothetical protein